MWFVNKNYTKSFFAEHSKNQILFFHYFFHYPSQDPFKRVLLRKSADLLSELRYHSFPYSLLVLHFFRCLFWLLLIRYQDSSGILLSSEFSSGRLY